MYAMAGSEANSCKNKLLKNYKSNEETLQHTYVGYVMVLMVLQQSQSKKIPESRTSCTRVLIILKYEGLGNLEVIRVFPEWCLGNGYIGLDLHKNSKRSKPSSLSLDRT
jgi:hypothetical protein